MPKLDEEDSSNRATPSGTTRPSRSESVSSSSSSGSGTTTVLTHDNNVAKHRKTDRNRKVKYSYRSRKKRRQFSKQSRYNTHSDSSQLDPPKTVSNTSGEDDSSVTSWTKTWTQCVGHLGEENSHKKVAVRYGPMISRLSRIRKIEEVWRILNDSRTKLRRGRGRKEVEVSPPEDPTSPTSDWLYGWFQSSSTVKQAENDSLLSHLIMGYTKEDGTHPEIRLNKFVPPCSGGSIVWDNVLYIRVETKIVWQRFGVKIKIVREQTTVSNNWRPDEDEQKLEAKGETFDNSDNSLVFCGVVCICVGAFGMIVVGLWLFAHFRG